MESVTPVVSYSDLEKASIRTEDDSHEDAEVIFELERDKAKVSQIVSTKCGCTKHGGDCFKKIGFELNKDLGSQGTSKMVDLVYNAISANSQRSQEERRDFFMTEISTFFDPDSPGRYKWSLRISEGLLAKRYLCCRTAFLLTHKVSSGFIDGVIQRLKNGENSKARVSYSEKTSFVNATDLDSKSKRLHLTNRISKEVLNVTGGAISFSQDQASAAVMPGEQACPGFQDWYFWFKDFVYLNGDDQPNGKNHGEVHLDCTTKEAIYDDYKEEMRLFDKEALSSDTFNRKWEIHYPHVFIRKYKLVAGKCATCLLLSRLRKEATTRRALELIKVVHIMHRSMYMNERAAYKARQLEAIQNPTRVCSINLDGMSSDKNDVPHNGDQKSYEPRLSSQTIGALMHGQSLTLYKFGNTIPKGANTSVFVVHSQLDAFKSKFGHYPEKLYIQSDGGTENVSETFLAMLELLVIKRVVREICLTRLPVGHTHCDLDARFGDIWRHSRCKFIPSPAIYKKMILTEVWPNSRSGFRILYQDVVIVPNYDDFIKGHIDRKFGQYARESHTKLSWCFEAVKVSDANPLGVRTMYRAFSADEAVEIVEKGKNLAPAGNEYEIWSHLGVQALNTVSRWLPRPLSAEDAIVGLPSILISIPDKGMKPTPLPFVPDSYDAFMKVYEQSRKWFAGFEQHLADWDHFKDNVAPNSQSVEVFLKSGHPNAKFNVPVYFFLYTPIPVPPPRWADSLIQSGPAQRNAMQDVRSLLQQYQVPTVVAGASTTITGSIPEPDRIRVFTPEENATLAEVIKDRDRYGLSSLFSPKMQAQHITDILSRRIGEFGSAIRISGMSKALLQVKLLECDSADFVRKLRCLRTEDITQVETYVPGGMVLLAEPDVASIREQGVQVTLPALEILLKLRNDREEDLAKAMLGLRTGSPRRRNDIFIGPDVITSIIDASSPRVEVFAAARDDAREDADDEFHEGDDLDSPHRPNNRAKRNSHAHRRKGTKKRKADKGQVLQEMDYNIGDATVQAHLSRISPFWRGDLFGHANQLFFFVPRQSSGNDYYALVIVHVPYQKIILVDPSWTSNDEPDQKIASYIREVDAILAFLVSETKHGVHFDLPRWKKQTRPADTNQTPRLTPFELKNSGMLCLWVADFISGGLPPSFSFDSHLTLLRKRACLFAITQKWS